MRHLLGVVVSLGLVAGCNGNDNGAEPSATAAVSAASPSDAPTAISSETPSGGPSRRGPSVVDLLSAPVPALCTHPSGTLVGGSLPGIRSGGGHVTIATEASDYTEPPVSVDLTGDGVDELVAVIDCDAGGVSWPQVLAVYQTGPELLGYVDLGDVSHAEHSTIKRLAAGANGVTLDWASTDGCCSHERLSTGRVLWDGASVAIRDVTTLTVPDRQCPLADIEDAWAGKKQHCLEPEVLSHLFYPGVPFSTAWADGYLEQVVFLQLRLRDLGYPVAVDGKFGSQTESVVRRYQADKHFVEDGIVGAQTWKGLFGLGRA